MLALKELAFLCIVLICTLGYGSSIDYSDMDFVSESVMSYSKGHKKTVTLYKPKLDKVALPKPAVPGPGSSVRRAGAGFGGAGAGAAGSGSIGLRRLSIRPHIRRKEKPTFSGVPLDSHGGYASYGDGLPSDPYPGFRRAPKEKLTFIAQNKTYNKRTTPSNQFIEAVSSIERGTAEAKATNQWSKKSGLFSLQETKRDLELAVKHGKYQYAREKLGRALYHIKHSKVQGTWPVTMNETTQANATTTNQATSYMDDLRKSLGSERFDEFLAVQGDVTLMFAIDTTGSMSDDIEAAKRIAVDVINHPRENPVRYILSPFNDPSVGPVIFKNSSQGAHFVQEISKLTARGGGDCAEKTLGGILNALYEEPDHGSPLYVITDASAKDQQRTNIEEAKELAKMHGVTVNFFTTGNNCGYRQFNAFEEIADATSGQVLELLNHEELRKLTGFTGSVLGGSNVICTAGSLESIRPLTKYNIMVDDSIDAMSVSITTQERNEGGAITLRDPSGKTITTGKLSMQKVSVYELQKPKVGTWTLEVPPKVGRYRFFVKSTSDSNIDFKHFFMQSMPGNITDFPVSDPLIGYKSKVILRLAGHEKVQKDSIVLQLITKYGKHIKDITLQPDEQGMRYEGTFTPPSLPFKLKIKGTTKANNTFERISRNVVEPKPVLLRVVGSDNDLTLRPGTNSNVDMYVFNAGIDSGKLTIRVHDRLRYVSRLNRPFSLRVKKGEGKFFKIEFIVPSDAKEGASDTAIVSAWHSHGNGVTMTPVQLLVAN